MGALRECDDDDGGGDGDGDEAAAKPKAEGRGRGRCDADGAPVVRARHFDRALDNVLPSVSPKDERS